MLSSEVLKKIKSYVYLLSDPKTNEIFYAGKGKGNRVFSHLKDTADTDKVKKMRKKYQYKSVEHYWKSGAQNPIRYTFK